MFSHKKQFFFQILVLNYFLVIPSSDAYARYPQKALMINGYYSKYQWIDFIRKVVHSLGVSINKFF